jgi:phenylalanyl-tRNA synthetase beta chain
LRQAVWVAEIDLDWLVAAPLRSLTFRGYSKYPAVQRDYSLVVPEERRYGEIEAVVRDLDLESLQDLRPVDFFRGAGLAAGHYSLLLRVTFQSMTRTLSSDDIGAMSQRIQDALRTLGVRLRA